MAAPSSPLSDSTPEPAHAPSDPIAVVPGPARPAPSSPPFARRLRLPAWLGALLLVAAVFLVYQPAWHGEAVFDDTDHLTPPELQSTEGLARIWTELGVVSQYYPVTHSLFWVQQRLWGDAMLGYHLSNLALHALATLLLLRFLRRLDLPGAWFAAAVFALHPVQVESVAWISEQKNTLSTVFYFAAALAWLRFDLTRRPSAYAALVVLFVLGLLSKAVVATLPAALLVLIWWWRGRVDWRRDLAPLLPLLVLGIASGVFTAWVERRFIGAEGADHALAPLERALLAGRVLWFYAGKLLWPAELVFIYPRWTLDAASVRQWFPAISSAALVAAFWIRRRSGRGPLAAALLFAGALVPVLGFLNVYPFVYSYVADHYVYLAAPVLFSAFSAGLVLALRRRGWQDHPAVPVAGFALLATLAALSWRQSRDYATAEALWRATVTRNPDSFVARANLSNLLLADGHVEESITHARRALELRPDFAEVHVNLGNALRAADKPDEARGHYEHAVKLRPDFAQAHYNLGALALARGDGKTAIAALSEAVRLSPDFIQARNTLANLLIELGRGAEALEHAQRVTAFRPDDADARRHLGNALVQSGRIDEGRAELEHALRLRPEFARAHHDLGYIAFQSGKADEADARFARAAELDPGFPTPNYFRATLRLQQGRPEEAIPYFERALAAVPSAPQTINDLGVALAQLGRGDEALARFRRAAELAPDFAAAHNNIGKIVQQQGHGPEAARHYRAALKLEPDNPETLANLAWVLATTPEDDTRNGVQAIYLAQRANQLAKGQDPYALRSLAAAFAENGRFAEAISATRAALRLAESTGDQSLAELLQAQLTLHQSNAPVREAPPASPSAPM
jgi:tetratricopeptide (TPR) repeat protein